MRLVLFIWFFTFHCLLSSCEECGIRREPTLAVFYPYQKPIIIKKIKVLQAIEDIPKEGVISSLSDPYGDLTLPVNLNADSTTYILEQDTRTDTLTVFYKKKIYDINQKCGYILDLEKPAKGREFVSTFKSVWISYDTYYSQTKGFNKSGGGGISVNIIAL